MFIPAKHREKAVLFTDVAVEKLQQAIVAQGREHDVVEYITVGRLDAWRGFDLIIEAFAKAAKENSNIHLTIVGKGADKQRLQQLTRERGVGEKVAFAGKVEMDEYYRLLAASDVVINASLKEGAVTVSFDSMAMGKPLICLDTTGYTRYFSNEYAIVVPRTGREEVVAKLAAAMEQMTDANKRNTIGQKARNVGAQFTWKARGEEYKELLMKRFENNK